ncbi:SDR family NAD(P)-dependent oxidoreductase [Seonamhaeicola aphaedonensis]|uniref:Short-subunit dehydrogenase n=1 Tax=Seonamhaeicola aphaedonensis TaxID=1461338 RepID=A0A3D9HL65_9FLAO|nr:SDR family oxidoreductase [Seonamhaeicola aphaedonensis]RED50155.1 hypothetical protein DFQ02_101178 [Seonamhaeicola aphaedonensis]
MKRTEYKTALVTGAASGLGWEFSKILAKNNFNLVLIDINIHKLHEAKKLIERKHTVKVITLVKDLSRPNISEEIFKDINTIDILINNAGFGVFGHFVNTSWKSESKMLDLHIKTTTELTKKALEIMTEQGYGKILNVASMAAFQPGPLMSIYYASKAYILSFSLAIANELKGTGVTVTALCPGQTKTNFQKVVSASSSPNKIKFNMSDAKTVASYGYAALIKGKAIAIPGFLNRFLALLTRFIPRNTVTAIVRKIQEKNRSKIILQK